MKKLMVMAVMMSLGFAAQAIVSNPFTLRWFANGVRACDSSEDGYSGSATLYLEIGNLKAIVKGDMNCGALNWYGNNPFVESSDSPVDHLINQESSAYYTMTDKNGNMFKSSTIDKYIQDIFDLAGLTFDFGDSGTWTIPEPTSGVLLLFGLAGLALKRKRLIEYRLSR